MWQYCCRSYDGLGDWSISSISIYIFNVSATLFSDADEQWQEIEHRITYKMYKSLKIKFFREKYQEIEDKKKKKKKKLF